MINKEIVVIGGGPAGLAAAIESSRLKAEVLVIDENKKPGGQLFKQIHKFFGSSEHNAGTRGMDIGENLLKDTVDNGVEVWLDSAAIGIFDDNKVAVVRTKEDGTKETVVVRGSRILIATGGSENAIHFKGWTAPGVMGAGAAQTMINVNRVLPGKKVLMVGSGNVGLIVSYQLMQAGAEVVGIVEARNRIGGYAVHASKIKRAGVPFYLGHTIIEGNIKEGVIEGATICEIDENFTPIPGTEKKLDSDTICIAAGLRPLSELAQMGGVTHEYIGALGGWTPLHDEDMKSTKEGIYVAGDTAGVEEANSAMDEGRLAGVAMAESLGYISLEDASKKKNEIRDRLTSLRQGPFGEVRLKSKNDILSKREGA